MRRVLRRAIVALVLALSVLTSSVQLAGAARANDDGGPFPGISGSPAQSGIFDGSGAVASAEALSQWRGTPITRYVDYLGGQTWAEIENPNWWSSQWRDSGIALTYSVSMVPRSGGGTLEEGATGAYNYHFRRLAQRLVANGQPDVIIRMGWEFNGSWMWWSATKDPQAFVQYWRQIVTTMRSVPGARFRFDWNPSRGTSVPGFKDESAYPGDTYVDYIGMDVYDQSWAPGASDPAVRWANIVNCPYGLAWHAAFAAEHHKRMTFPEWGLSWRSDGYGGGDDPYFIQQMHSWMANHDVAYESYFDVDMSNDELHAFKHFPMATQTYLALWGPQTPVT